MIKTKFSFTSFLCNLTLNLNHQKLKLFVTTSSHNTWSYKWCSCNKNGNAGLISFSTILSSTLEIGLVNFKNPIVSLILLYQSKSAKLVSDEYITVYKVFKHTSIADIKASAYLYLFYSHIYVSSYML